MQETLEHKTEIKWPIRRSLQIQVRGSESQEQEVLVILRDSLFLSEAARRVLFSTLNGAECTAGRWACGAKKGLWALHE